MITKEIYRNFTQDNPSNDTDYYQYYIQPSRLSPLIHGFFLPHFRHNTPQAAIHPSLTQQLPEDHYSGFYNEYTMNYPAFSNLFCACIFPYTSIQCQKLLIDRRFSLFQNVQVSSFHPPFIVFSIS